MAHCRESPPVRVFPQSPRSLVAVFRAACALSALFSLGASTGRAAVPLKKTSFVVVVARDLGFSDLGCYGGEMETPYLDYLASKGLRFTQAYQPAGAGMAQVALLTGFYPQHLFGQKPAEELASGGGLPPRPAWAAALPEALKTGGYRCYHAGVWSLAGTPQEGGFDRSFTLLADGSFRTEEGVEANRASEAPPGEAVSERLCELLRGHAEQMRGKPFFALAALGGFPSREAAAPVQEAESMRFGAGREFVCRERLERLWSMGMLLNAEFVRVVPAISEADRLQREGVRPSEFQRRMAIQAARVEQMDRQVGRILEQIKAMGLWEQTAVLFLSESGGGGPVTTAELAEQVPVHAPLRESACGLHEAGIATPLVVHWPAGIHSRGEPREQFVHLVDLAPTVLKIAGVSGPKKVGEALVPGADGVDLSALLRENKALGQRSLWWEKSGGRAFRLGDWKWVAPKDKPVELYYLKEDRSETRDLAELNLERVQEMEIQWTRTAERFRGDAEGGASGPAAAGPGNKPGR
jgi:arylsulfatase A-like enzyme